jgi:XTP/dITP diphosphohydrolase
MQFVLATANAHKADEMRAILKPLGIELLARPRDVPEVDETEDTLEGNALLKARALVVATGLPAIADDTGLFVDALDGRPGVHSARYAGEDASYQDNVTKLLGELIDVAAPRRARFRSVIAVAYPQGDWFSVAGVLEGTICLEARGERGFGDHRTLGELTPDEKNRVSHRALALRELAEKLGTK